MKKFFLIIAIITYCSCASKKTEQVATPVPVVPQADTTTPDFFPVTDYLKGQALSFDSLLVTPIHITTVKERSDTQFMKREELKTALQTFFSPEINKTNLTQFFKESQFKDLSINAITFTYSPSAKIPDSIGLINWNVYVNPETQNVEKVYIVKKIKGINQDTIQQLLWQSDRSASITTILNNADGKMDLLKTEKYVWSAE